MAQSRRPTARLLLAVLLSLSSWQTVLAVQLSPTPANSNILANSSTSSAQCQNQGLSGECNGVICCCYKGGGGFVKINPVGNSCKRSFGGEQVWTYARLQSLYSLQTSAQWVRQYAESA
ncbi:hypothetical protein ABBQ32_005350 [Trebouxia sp. C0010 RCD-2024]